MSSAASCRIGRSAANLRGAEQLVLGGHGADDNAAAVAANAFEARDVVEIDKVFGCRQPELHHRDQAVTAGERPRFVPKGGEQLDGICQVFRTVIAECSRDHDSSLVPYGRNCSPFLVREAGPGRRCRQAALRKHRTNSRIWHEVRFLPHELRQAD